MYTCKDQKIIIKTKEKPSGSELKQYYAYEPYYAYAAWCDN